MCIIAVQPVGVQIPEEYIDNMWQNNPDMGGYSFVRKDVLETKKFSTKQEFKDSYFSDWLKYKDESPFLLHFRIKTHGAITLDNCHPFVVNKDIVFAHNGIIPIKIPKKFKQYSDTWTFNRLVLQQLPKNFLANPAIMSLIEAFIETSKLAFLKRDKSFVIVNEQAGEWHRDVWYSNDTYLDIWDTVAYGYSYYKRPPSTAITWPYKGSTTTPSVVSTTETDHLKDDAFYSTLSDVEAIEAGYENSWNHRYIHQKWVQHYWNMTQIILDDKRYEKLMEYVLEAGDDFASAYLDNSILAQALGEELPPREEEQDEVDLNFYARLTKEDENVIAGFAQSVGMEFDDVYDDKELVERILGPGFVDVVNEYERSNKVAS